MPSITVEEAKNMKVTELKSALKSRGAPQSGKKEELYMRLLQLLEQDEIKDESHLTKSFGTVIHSPSEKDNLKSDVEISEPVPAFTEEKKQVVATPEILSSSENIINEISNNNSSENKKVPLEATKISLDTPASTDLNIGIVK
jgi:hypothetical protein